MSQERLEQAAIQGYCELRAAREDLADARRKLGERKVEAAPERALPRRMYGYEVDQYRRRIGLGHYQRVDEAYERASVLHQSERKFYEENHAELYDMALREMEADGIAFSEGDPKAVTLYHFGQEIVELEQASPLDALGAKIVQISQKYIDQAGEVLAAPSFP